MNTNLPFYEMPMLSIDTETTGIDPFEARIVTSSCVYDTPSEQAIIKNWLVDPGVEIPEGASDVHGVTNEHAMLFGQDPVDMLTDMAAAITDWVSQGFPLVVFNAPYDLTLLLEEFKRYHVAFNGDFGNVIDPFVLDKWFDQWRKGKRTLEATSAHYGVKLDGAHSADADALATVKLARVLGAKLRPANMTAKDIHMAQIEQKRKQAEGYQNYLRRTDSQAVVDGSWPIRTQA